MPQRAWNAKRERQYEHVKEGLEERGSPEDEAEEIAARTINKERARSGERSRPAGRRPRTSRPGVAAECGRTGAPAEGPGTSSIRRPGRRTSRAAPR